MFNCLVFSKLFYCSTVWSGTFKQIIHKLQLVQNFAARVLTNTSKFDHFAPALRELGWSSIKHLLLVRDVTQLYKIVNGLAPSYLNSYINKRTGIHSYNTRFRENLDVPMCRTATAQRSFHYRSIITWNSLSASTRNSKTLTGDFANQNATQPETPPEVICAQSASLRMLGAKLQRVFFTFRTRGWHLQRFQKT